MANWTAILERLSEEYFAAERNGDWVKAAQKLWDFNEIHARYGAGFNEKYGI